MSLFFLYPKSGIILTFFSVYSDVFFDIFFGLFRRFIDIFFGLFFDLYSSIFFDVLSVYSDVFSTFYSVFYSSVIFFLSLPEICSWQSSFSAAILPEKKKSKWVSHIWENAWNLTDFVTKWFNKLIYYDFVVIIRRIPTLVASYQFSSGRCLMSSFG